MTTTAAVPRLVCTTEAPPPCDCVYLSFPSKRNKEEQGVKKKIRTFLSQGIISMSGCARKGSNDRRKIVKRSSLQILSTEKKSPPHFSRERKNMYRLKKKGIIASVDL